MSNKDKFIDILKNAFQEFKNLYKEINEEIKEINEEFFLAKYMEITEWKTMNIKYEGAFIAVSNINNNTIVLNSENQSIIKENLPYVLMHEYFHIKNNDFAALRKNTILNPDSSTIETADLFAYLFFSQIGKDENKNYERFIPEKIKSFLEENYEKVINEFEETI